MIDNIINVALLLAISGCSFQLLRDDKSIKKKLGAVAFGFSLIALGTLLIYPFHGTEGVIEMLKMQKAHINGKFIIAGYGCLIGTVLSALAFNKKQ